MNGCQADSTTGPFSVRNIKRYTKTYHIEIHWIFKNTTLKWKSWKSENIQDKSENWDVQFSYIMYIKTWLKLQVKRLKTFIDLDGNFVD